MKNTHKNKGFRDRRALIENQLVPRRDGADRPACHGLTPPGGTPARSSLPLCVTPYRDLGLPGVTQ